MPLKEKDYSNDEGLKDKSLLDDWKCTCDCGCSKSNDRVNDQCDDCDNGIHYDDINHVYVNYEEEESLR